MKNKPCNHIKSFMDLIDEYPEVLEAMKLEFAKGNGFSHEDALKIVENLNK